MFLTVDIILATVPSRHITNNPYADISVGILIIVGGILFFIYRHPIGDFTGYYVGDGKIVDKPTPGCLLIPFAIAIIAGGSFIILKSINTLLAGP